MKIEVSQNWTTTKVITVEEQNEEIARQKADNGDYDELFDKEDEIIADETTYIICKLGD